MERRPTSLLSRAGLIVVSLLLSLAASELALRVLWTNPYRNERPESILKLRLHHALADTPIDRRLLDPELPPGRLRIDERSYIRPARRFEDPSATVAFLGGSTTECAAVAEPLRFPALVSTLLEERGLRVNTLNAARSGSTTHDSLNILLNHVSQDHPDLVVMMHAWNDVGVLWREGSYASRSGDPAGFRAVARWSLQKASVHSSLLGLSRFWFTVNSMRRRPFDLAELSSQPRDQEVISHQEFEWRVRAFVGLARAFEIEPVLMTQPALPLRGPATPEWIDERNQARFNDVVRAVARGEGARLIDLARHVAGHTADPVESSRIFYDGVHVTDYGSRIYAEYIASELQAALTASR